MPCDNFMYCEKCQKVYANSRLKKDIAFYYNPLKLDIATQNMKYNYGKNQNDKLCPICCILLKDTQDGVEEKIPGDQSPDKTGAKDKPAVAYYLKCRYCLWSTLHFRANLNGSDHNKFVTELYKRHKFVRDSEVTDSLTYIQERLKMTNKILNYENMAHERAGIGRTLRDPVETKGVKEAWTPQHALNKWEESKKYTLTDKVMREHGRRIRKTTVKAYGSEDDQFAKDEVQTPAADKPTDGAKKKDVSSDDESDQESSNSEEDKKKPGKGKATIADSTLNIIENLGSPDKGKDPNSNEEEIEKKVKEVFKDNDPLIANEKPKTYDTIDEFIKDFAPVNVNKNLFEQLPTKVFKGFNSLIPMCSLVMPVVNKLCPLESCKAGLVFYEKSSENFSLKFTSDMSKYMPIFRLGKIEPSQNPDWKVFIFVLRNRTKFDSKIHFKMQNLLGEGNYKFKNGTFEEDKMLTASEKDQAQSVCKLEIEVKNSFSGDIVLATEINEILESAESLLVKIDLIIQLGDEETKKSYLAKYP